jgi:LysM repeat protein
MMSMHNPIRYLNRLALAGLVAMTLALSGAAEPAATGIDMAVEPAAAGIGMPTAEIAVAADTARTHIVSAGETLYSISKHYGVGVEQLRAWNKLEGVTLGIGVELVVRDPYLAPSSEAPASPSAAAIAQAEQVAAVPASMQSTYIVRAGDTLFGIARRFDVTVKQLRDRNRLRSDEIAVGQVLTIRTVPSTPSLAAASADAKESPASAPQGRFTLHTLREGDQAMAVAGRFGMDSTEFAALNPGIDPASLRAGQSITVLLPQNRIFPNPYRRAVPSLDSSEAWVTAYPASHRAMSTASGELHDPSAFTAGHSSLPLGSLVLLQHPQNGLSVLVRINDRVPGGSLRVSQAVVDFLRLLPDAASAAPAGAPSGQTVRYRAIVGRADAISR